jgi:hypothetical protein
VARIFGYWRREREPDVHGRVGVGAIAHQLGIPAEHVRAVGESSVPPAPLRDAPAGFFGIALHRLHDCGDFSIRLHLDGSTPDGVIDKLVLGVVPVAAMIAGPGEPFIPGTRAR